MSQLKSEFISRVVRFFKFRDIKIDAVKTESLTDFLYEQFEKQGRFNNKKNTFNLSAKFMLGAIADFLKMKPAHTLELFKTLRERRRFTNYDPSYKEELSSNREVKSIIQLLGRKHKPKYKITKADGAPLTPARTAKSKSHLSSFDVGFSPLVPEAKQKPRKCAISSDKSEFEQDMTNSEMALWRKKTPKKNGLFSPDRIRISKVESSNSEKEKKLSDIYDSVAKKNTTEHFEFTVTQEDILSRINVKRPVSQKKVMGNYSAMEIMKAIGVIITEKQNGRHFHWAHRQGWSLKGEQSKENLDPMTAGSNFDTLFKVEAPLKELLFGKVVDEVLVKGEVEFDKDSGLPFKVTYRLSWGTTQFIEVVIDPMSHRVPTVNEHEMAKSFFGMSAT